MFGNELFIAVNPSHSEVLDLIKHMSTKTVRFVYSFENLYVSSAYTIVHIELLKKISNNLKDIDDWIIGTATFDFTLNLWHIQKAYNLVNNKDSLHYKKISENKLFDILPAPFGCVK